MWGKDVSSNPHFDLSFALLGEHDYLGEMKLFWEEIREECKNTSSHFAI